LFLKHMQAEIHSQFSGIKQSESLYKVLKTTGSVGAVGEAGAKDSVTYDQEFRWKDTIIPYTYKIVDGKFTNLGRTIEEISDPKELGGDRVGRLLKIEKEMVSDPSKKQAAFFSEDLGVGFNRSFFYIFERDGQEANKINALAIEYQGSQSEGLNFLNQLGKRSENFNNEKDFVPHFAKPLYFNEENTIRVKDIFQAAKTSYIGDQRRQEMQPYLHRLARDSVGFYQLVERVKKEETERAAQLVEQVSNLLKQKGVSEAMGILGQALAASANNFKELQIATKTAARQGESPSGLSNLASLRNDRNFAKFESSKRFFSQPARIKRHRGGSGGRGFYRWQIADELDQTGGVAPIFRKPRLTPEEASKQLEYAKKAKDSPEAYLFHKKGSLADAILHGEVLKKKDGILVSDEHRLEQASGVGRVERTVKKGREKAEVGKKGVNLGENVVFKAAPYREVRKDGARFSKRASENQKRPEKKSAKASEKPIFVWQKIQKPEAKVTKAKSAEKAGVRVKKKAEAKAGSFLEIKVVRVAEEKRKRMIGKIERKQKREARKRFRREILAYKKREKIANLEMKRFKKRLKLLRSVERFILINNKGKKLDKKQILLRRKMFRLVGAWWGTESVNFKKMKEGKITELMLRRRQRETMGRFSRLEKNQKMEKRKSLQIFRLRRRLMKEFKKAGGSEKLTRKEMLKRRNLTRKIFSALEKRDSLERGKLLKGKKNAFGVLFESRFLKKAGKISLIRGEIRLEKKKRKRMENRKDFRPVYRVQKGNGFLHYLQKGPNGRTNGHTKFKTKLPIVELEHLYTSGQKPRMFTNGGKNRRKNQFPDFGIIYLYRLPQYQFKHIII